MVKCSMPTSPPRDCPPELVPALMVCSYLWFCAIGTVLDFGSSAKARPSSRILHQFVVLAVATELTFVLLLAAVPELGILGVEVPHYA